MISSIALRTGKSGGKNYDGDFVVNTFDNGIFEILIVNKSGGKRVIATGNINDGDQKPFLEGVNKLSSRSYMSKI